MGRFCSISKWPFILLLIQVLLFHDQNYGIHYEYTVPVNYTAENQSEPEKPQDSLFIWTHSGWEGCSVQCGGGECRGRGLGGAWSFAEGWSKFRALCSQCTEQGKASHITCICLHRSVTTSHCKSLCKTLRQRLPISYTLELCPLAALPMAQGPQTLS